VRGAQYLVGLIIPALFASSGYSQQWFVQGTRNLPREAPRHTITGTVYNGLTGEPVRRALVRMWGPQPATVLTGVDGRFEIEDVPEGPINLTATKPGFFDAQSMPRQWKQKLEAQVAGPGSNDFRVLLYPAGRITGQVSDPDGDPVEQAQVQVFAEQITNGHKVWQQRSSTSSDDDGQYRIGNLVPGRYIVYAMGHVLPGLSLDAPKQVSAPLYYPDARDRTSAQRIDIQPGQEFRADFHLRAERGFRISGTFTGAPATSGVSLSIQNENGQILSFGNINVDQSHGRFVVTAVPAGTWTVKLFANDNTGHFYQVRQDVAVNGSDVDNLPLVLHPSVSIPVVVNHASTQPEPELQPGGARRIVNATLTAADPLIFQQHGMVWHPEREAWFFDNVEEGRYKLDVQGWRDECLDSASYGNIDLLRNYLVVSSGGTSGPITIDMRSDCATLTARMAPGADQALAFVVVVPTSSFSEPKVLQAVAQGRLPQPAGPALTLSPGTYQVYAFTTLEDLEYANPEVLREYPNQTIDLSPGQKLELTVDPIEPKGQ